MFWNSVFASRLGKKSVILLFRINIAMSAQLYYFKLMQTHIYVMGTSITRTEDPGRLQSMGPQRVRPDKWPRVCACIPIGSLANLIQKREKKVFAAKGESVCQSSKCKSLDHLDLKSGSPDKCYVKGHPLVIVDRFQARRVSSHGTACCIWDLLHFHLDLGQSSTSVTFEKFTFKLSFGFCIGISKAKLIQSCFVVTYVENLRTRRIN